MTNKFDEAFRNVHTNITAQSVYKDLEQLDLKRCKMNTRWIWELLQNAHDSSPTPDSLIVSVDYSSDEPRELVFLHDGGRFKETDIAHLIFSGTTKIDEPEVLGQFGSGFLTTHLLSPEVEVSGHFTHDQWFNFRLVRKCDNQVSKREAIKALEESMNQAWANCKCLSPQKPSSISNPFNTRFAYPISGKEARKAVKDGIKTLEQCAPYVMAFNQAFSRIEIRKPSEMLCFKITRGPMGASGIQQIIVTESRNGNLEKREYLLAQGEKASVIVPLELNGNDSVCLPVVETPRLFLGFPLVSTDIFGFPAVINGKFSPTEDRASAPLESSKNQIVIEEAYALYISLLQHATAGDWHHVHRWIKIPSIEHLIGQPWLKTHIIENFIEEICQIPAVLTEAGKTIAPKEAYLPLAGNDDGVKELWSLLDDIQEYHKKLPRRDEVTEWREVIKGWAKVKDCQTSNLPNVGVVHGRKLVSYIEEKCSDLKDLQNLLQKGVCAVKWLDRLYGFLKKDQLSYNVIHEFPFVPNQVGKFHYLKELSLDKSGDDELKYIDKLLGGSILKQLRHTGLTSLEDEDDVKELHDKEIVELLSKKLRKPDEKIPDDNLKKASSQLFAWVVNSDRKDYLDLLLDVPVFTKDGKPHHSLESTIYNGETLLAPVCSWPKDLQKCQDIFPPNRILADDFFKEVRDSKVWECLDKEGLVRRNVIINDEKIVNSQDFLLVGEFGEDDKSHESSEVVFVTNIVERVEVMKRVKGNSNYVPPFWQLLTGDAQGLEVRKATCTSCETPHEFEYYPAEWLMRVREDKWIRGKDRGYAIPNASSLAQMLRDNKLELRFLTENLVSNKIMEIIGIQQSDLRLEFIAEEKEKRDILINTATRLHDSPQLLHHIQDNENLPQELEKILEATGGDLSQIVENVGEQKEQQDRMDENRDFGKQVENWVKQILEQILKPKGFSVTSKRTGSDLEILPETFDISTQEIIQNNDKKWLVEVKGTRVQNVKMSFEQTKSALDREEEFLLCVVPIRKNTQPNFDNVRENILFIKNIHEKLGNRVAKLCNSIDIQKEVTDKTPDDTSPGIVLDFEKGKAGIRVQQSVWEAEGFPLTDLIERLK